jgi:hypothetical protein
MPRWYRLVTLEQSAQRGDRVSAGPRANAGRTLRDRFARPEGAALATTSRMHRSSWILVTGYGRELDCEVSAHAIIGKPCDAGALRELLRLVPLLSEVTRSEAIW